MNLKSRQKANMQKEIVKYKALKSEEKVLMATSKELYKKCLALHSKLEDEKDYDEKYNELTHETETLRKPTVDLCEEMKGLRVKIHSITACKEAYKSVKAAKKALATQHDSLPKETEKMMKKVREKPALQNRNNVTREETEALGRAYQARKWWTPH